MNLKFLHPLNNLSRFSVSAGLLTGLLISANVGQSQDKIPRSTLVDMARDQFSVLCQSETFSRCMGFSSKACTDLSETAISQCLLNLPEEISLDKLDNSALESCPQSVFADAGFSEEKASECFDNAMQAGG